MAQFTGMDISEVRSLAAQLTRASEEINHLTTTLTGKLEHTPWVGPDRERFISDWHSHHRQSLQSVSTALTDASRVAQQNAQAQEDTSNN